MLVSLAGTISAGYTTDDSNSDSLGKCSSTVYTVLESEGMGSGFILASLGEVVNAEAVVERVNPNKQRL